MGNYNFSKEAAVAASQNIKERDYWIKKLSGDLEKSTFPYTSERPGINEWVIDAVKFKFSGELFSRLLKLSNNSDYRMHIIMVSGLVLLLYKYTGRKDIIVGAPIYKQEIEGKLINTVLALRNQVEINLTFKELLLQVAQTVFEANENQNYPIETLLYKLKMPVSGNQFPLFDIAILLKNIHDKNYLKHIKLNIIFTFLRTDQAVEGILEYNAALYDKDFLDRLINHFTNLMQKCLFDLELNISAVDVLSKQEKTQLLIDFNSNKADFPRDRTIYQLIETHAETKPDRIALSFRGTHLTYGELNKKANQVFNFLTSEKNIQRENPVGIFMDRSINIIVTILGIWKSGAFYIPINSSFPGNRIKAIINSAKIEVLFSEKKYIKILNELQWECESLHTFLCMDSTDIYSEKEQEKNMLMDNEFWDMIVENALDEITEGGWLSSYTRKPLSPKIMNEYSKNVLIKLGPILQKEMRVLEIGCSSGLTMYKIAPKVGYYLGTDISNACIEKNKKRVKERRYHNIALACIASHNIDSIQEKNFDLVIMNSVIQSFQGHNYLRQVIMKSIHLMREIGYIFIGDVLDLESKETFIQELQNFKIKNTDKDYETLTDWSWVLFFSRLFFEDLLHEFPEIQEIVPSKKIYTIENELTRFRYDVLIKIDKTQHPAGKSKIRHKYQYDSRMLKKYDVEEGPATKKKVINPQNLAYVIYTSGTTGTPKGAMVEHIGMMNHIQAKIHDLQITGNSAIAQNASPTFDISVWQFFASLVLGGRTVIYSDELVMDPAQLISRLKKDQITIIEVVPSYLSLILEYLDLKFETFEHLKYLVVTGETVKPSLLKRWHSKYPGVKIVNAYGPTEASDDITHYIMERIHDRERVPIGRTVQNLNIYIVDKEMNLCPIGVKGEICVSGVGVGRGYLNEPEQTKQVFMEDPFVEKKEVRLYKTGDLGRWLSDGTIDFFGRKDYQVKIRGFRIELGEIENKLLKHANVKEAVVIDTEDENENKYLCAYVVAKGILEVLELKNYLAEGLPDYMVPLRFVELEQMPLTPNGKIDRKALSTLYDENLAEINYITKEMLQKIAANLGNQLAKKNVIEENESKEYVLSKEERKKILYSFNDTQVDYPADKTIQELFEDQAEKTPRNVAIIYKGRHLSYSKLNERTNRLAKVLRALGVKADRIVGIIAERTEELIIGIIGILRAGGAYLPIDPENPVERKKYMLEFSEVELLLTNCNADRDLESIVSKVIYLNSDESCKGDSTNPPLINTSKDLAYVMHTSGTTGTPKGVMIENRSIVNLVKGITDIIDFDESDIILSVIPPSFDMFGSETVLPLTIGAKVVIGITEEQRNYSLTASALIKYCTTIFQDTPSHLQLLLSDNKTVESLKYLRYLLLAGEALPESVKEKASQVIAGKVFNLYGPTETTIFSTGKDVTGENSLNIGKPLANTRILILSSTKELLPIGVTGELCIGGDGVARGYLKREDLTTEKFIENPFSEGERIYKTGDLARWLPDGNIEFLGRMDHQIQIRGIRVEPGEIESHLLMHNDIKEAAVVAKQNENGGTPELCACIVAGRKLSEAKLREYLLQKLPLYMLPTYFVQLEQMPLIPSKKVNRRLLEAINVKKISEKGYEAPRDEVEKKLAKIWGEVLGRDFVGINENFFMIGGDSIKTIQIASRMNRMGYRVEMRDLFQNPTIDKLAPLVKRVKRHKDQSIITGIVPLTPVQKMFFEKSPIDPHHFNQAVMLHSVKRLEGKAVKTIFQKLQEHHDMLRTTFKEENGEIIQENHGLNYPLSFQEYDFRDLTDRQKTMELLEARANEIQSSINLKDGPLMNLGLFHLHDGERLLIVIHHLVVDGISWRILFEDIDTLYQQNKKAEEMKLPLKTDSFKVWSKKLSQYANSSEFLKEKTYWRDLELTVETKGVGYIEKDYKVENSYVRDTELQSYTLSKEDTRLLTTKVNNAFNTEINDILLTALGLGIKNVFGYDRWLIALEAHGREDILKGIDINRTVGWFTSVYPVLVDFSFLPGDMDPEENLSYQIKKNKEMLRRIPNKGVGYGILKYLTAEKNKQEINFSLTPQIIFNYLGQFSAEVKKISFDIAKESSGNNQSKNIHREYELDVSGLIVNNQLEMTIRYSNKQFKREAIKKLLDSFGSQLIQIISFCSSRKEKELTPSDFTYSGLSIETVNQLQKQYQIEDIYTLTPLQEGMLFHAIYDSSSSAYFQQSSHRMHRDLDMALVERGINELFKRHDSLRTVFLYEGFERPIQLVLKTREVKLLYEDIRNIGNETDKKEFINRFKEKDRQRSFDLGKSVLMRAAILQVREAEYEFIWSFHHILMDGWCIGILINEFFEIYNSLLENRPYQLSKVPQYRAFIRWLEKRDKERSKTYWMNYLEGYDKPVSIPKIEALKSSNQAYKNEEVVLVLEKEKANRLNQLAMENNVTLNTVFQTLWGIILGKYNDTKDVVFGTVVSGRPTEIKEVESIVGLFINTIPVRIRFFEKTRFSELLHKVQQQAIDSEPYHHYPLAKIQSESLLKQKTLDHVFVFENYPVVKEPLEISNSESFEQANYDFGVMVSSRKSQAIKFVFNGNVYDHNSIYRIGNHCKNVLEQIIKNEKIYIDQLVLISGEEKKQILFEFNNPGVDYPRNKTTHELFENQVRLSPEKMVVLQGDKQLVYGELNFSANQLARKLREKGVKPNTIVGIMLKPSINMAVGILGILKVGGAYFPIDPNYPEARIKYMLQDIGVQLLISESNRDHLFENSKNPISNLNINTPPWHSGDGANLDNAANSSDLAYVIYTSGSTGRPKGVIIEHRHVVNTLIFRKEEYRMSSKDICLQLFSYTFDGFITSFFTPIISGAKVIILSEEVNKDIKKINEIIVKNNVTHFISVPALFRLIIESLSKKDAKTLRVVTLAGDRLTPNVLEISKNKNQDIEIAHEYGVTEAAVMSTIFRNQEKEDKIKIGKPIANTQIYMIDQQNKLLPIGVPGELCIAGAGIARGYLNIPELTVEKFTGNAFLKGGWLYRTGDLARWLPDGSVELLGRIDHQVKIRGFRIELGEIEDRLLEHEVIEEAVVTAQEDEGENKFLAAYYVEKKKNETELWPSVAEFFVYDDLLYYAITNDERRNESYRVAINRFVKDKVALDIGTGKDAILARFCIEAGAKKVYAIEILEETYKKAKEIIRQLDLEKKIILIHGDATKIQLPEKADVCLSEIVGPIGGSEGAAVILNKTRRLLKEDGIIIPGKSITKIAAAVLPDEVHKNPGFTETSGEYVEKIFKRLGYPFDLRICVKNFSKSNIISNAEVFEYLDFSKKVEEEGSDKINFVIHKNSRLDGFLVWLNLYTVEDEIIDILKHEHCWLPVFVPVFYPGIDVSKDDTIKAECSRTLSKNRTNPDYRIKGVLIRKNRENIEFEYDLPHFEKAYKKSTFHQKLFDGGEISIKKDACHKFSASDLRNHMSKNLPDYMIPSYFVELEGFPLTLAGKINRKALPNPKEIELEHAKYAAPRNSKENKLVEIWEEVLGRDKIGINENFFLMGGDSIKSIQIASRMNKAGYHLKVRDLFQYTTIAELSPFVRKSTQIVDQTMVTGFVPLTPSQRWFFENNHLNKNHFNQAVMLYMKESFAEDMIKMIFGEIQEHHDALRIRYQMKNGEIIQTNQGFDYPFSLQAHDFRNKENAVHLLENKANEIQASIDLESGPLMKLALFHLDDGDRLLIVIHHLVIDTVSWRLLFEDIETLYQQYKKGKPLMLPLKTHSFQNWSEKLSEFANSEPFLKEKHYWGELESVPVPKIEKDFEEKDNYLKDTNTFSFTLSEEETKLLLNEANQPFGTEINDILLTALGLGIKSTFGNDRMLIELEGHGREEILKEVDINRTVGWFTSIYPVLLDFSYAFVGKGLSRQIKEIKERLRRVPNKGIGYGILKYLTEAQYKKGMKFNLTPQIGFNYLGQFDVDLEQKSFGLAKESCGQVVDRKNQREHEFDVSGMIMNKRLEMSITYNIKQFKSETIETLSKNYKKELNRIILYCSTRSVREFTPSDFTYKGLSIETVDYLSAQYPIEDLYTLSPMQEGMLFYALYDKNSSAYFEQSSYRLRGKLDIVLVERSINELFKRYDVLRTVFIYEKVDRPIQVVLKDQKVDFYYENISGISTPEDKEIFVKELKAKDRERLFDLSKDVLMRVAILQLSGLEHEFRWSFHHILMDGWCTAILTSEFFEIYNSFLENRPYQLPAVTSYRAYIQWLEKKDTADSKIYWKKYLEGYNEQAAVPGMRTPGKNGLNYKKEEVVFLLKKKKTDGLIELAQRNQITLNTICQTIWGIILGRYNNTCDVVFGTVVSGRPSEIENVESMVGLFINTIPIRIQYEPNTKFNELLHNVQEKAVDSELYHYSPLADIQDESVLKQNLFDHILVFENYPIANQINDVIKSNEETKRVIPLELSKIESFEQTNYDFNLIIIPGEQLTIRFDYNANAYEGDFIRRISNHFDRVLIQVLNDSEQKVEELTILTGEEKKQLLYDFNDTGAEYPKDKTIHVLFEEQVERTPDHTALIGKTQGAGYGVHSEMTYKELNQKSNQLAHVLRKKGVQPDTIVGVMIQRSVEMIIGILGILKAGSAYLPIEPGYPPERIRYMLEDSDSPFLLTHKPGTFVEKIAFDREIFDFRYESLHHEDSRDLRNISTPENLVYTIYTSGSTGRPKGVLVKIRGFMNLLYWFTTEFTMSFHDRVLLIAPISFDLAQKNLFGSLITGGIICLAPPGLPDYLQLSHTIARERVTMINSAPSVFYPLIEFNWGDKFIKLKSLRYVFLGGESIHGDKLAQWLNSELCQCELINTYGPTECTDIASWYRVDKKDITKQENIPIGQPIYNVNLFVLGTHQEVLPIGAMGELCIGGIGFSRGYQNNQELTIEKFVHPPHLPNKMVYRTGDLARWLPDGNIEFLGRIDHQVKVRGFRIELGEIESQLLKHDKIKEAVVLLEEHEAKENYLFAAIVPHSFGSIDSPESLKISQVREFLAKHLPNYMIPSYFMQIEKLPLTPNGKVDRKALVLQGKKLSSGVEYTAPKSETEKIVANIWKELLDLDKVGVEDNFFDIGGNSIKAVQLNSRLNEAFEEGISIVALFEHVTIRSFTQYLIQKKMGEGALKGINRSEKINKVKAQRADRKIKRRRGK